MPGADEKYIIDNFENAVKNGYIKPFFQPIIRTLTGDICGAETLARWEDPKYGLLSPAYFVDVLEKHGLISKLDLCIADSLCYGYNYLMSQGRMPMRFSVNLSRIDFENEDIFEELTAVFNKYNVPPSAVCLEITESVTLDNADSFRGLFDKFHKAGFEIWMDDFGSGYTSLNVLKDYEFDVLKIDMKFLSSISARSRKIISSVINMAKSLGVHTLAEGVETKEQADFLNSVGCEMLQGYYFAKPMSAEKFQDFVENSKFALERPDEYDYWQAAGMMNFLSPNPFEDYDSAVYGANSAAQSSFPLELIEFRNERFYFPYRNEAHQRESAKLGLYNAKLIDELVNDRTKPYYYNTKKQFDETAQTKGVVKKDYIMGDIYYSYSTKFVAAAHDKIMIASSITVLGDEGIENRIEAINKYNRSLFTNFEAVNIVRPDKDESNRVYLSTSFKNDYATVSVRRGILIFAENELHPDDKERYIKFMDMDTVKERLLDAENGFLQQPFRIYSPGNGFVWRRVRMTIIPTLDDFRFIFSIQRMSEMEVMAFEALLKEKPELFE